MSDLYLQITHYPLMRSYALDLICPLANDASKRIAVRWDKYDPRTPGSKEKALGDAQGVAVAMQSVSNGLLPFHPEVLER